VQERSQHAARSNVVGVMQVVVLSRNRHCHTHCQKAPQGCFSIFNRCAACKCWQPHSWHENSWFHALDSNNAHSDWGILSCVTDDEGDSCVRERRSRREPHHARTTPTFAHRCADSIHCNPMLWVAEVKHVIVVWVATRRSLQLNNVGVVGVAHAARQRAFCALSGFCERAGNCSSAGWVCDAHDQRGVKF
jgi:hypothetical protein